MIGRLAGVTVLAVSLGASAGAQDAARVEKPAYPKEKMPDDDLEALTAYMLSLKK